MVVQEFLVEMQETSVFTPLWVATVIFCLWLFLIISCFSMFL